MVLDTHITNLVIAAQTENVYLDVADTLNPVRILYNIYPDFHRYNFTFEVAPFSKALNDSDFTWLLLTYNSNGGYLTQGNATSTTITFDVVDRDQDLVDTHMLWVYDFSDGNYSTLSKPFKVSYKGEVL